MTNKSAATAWFSVIMIIFFCFPELSPAQTVALWPFDEQIGIYPSSVISDISDNDYPLVIGPGGRIVEGKFGNALDAGQQPAIILPAEENIRMGLGEAPIPDGRTVPLMYWRNANFCALMTSGEKHLRKEVGFCQPTKTRLNLGAFDWTVEFWYYPAEANGEDGIVFEIGQGPRAENTMVTRLVLKGNRSAFILMNQAAKISLDIPSDKKKLMQESGQWVHLAFVYDAQTKQLLHYVDGLRQPLPEKAALQSLPAGDEDYMSIGRDGHWQHPLPGRLDELRFSEETVYDKNFAPPSSFSYVAGSEKQIPDLIKGESLLFENEQTPLILGSRKHLFIDDALIAEKKDISFVVNPPRMAERVIANIEGPFRKHLNIVEDEDGLLRIYNAVDDDYLAVRTSRDGIHWSVPDLPGGRYKNRTNIVLHESTGMGIVFIDPNAPAAERWKYLSDYHRRGIFIYTSADGWSFKRKKLAVLPFRSGSQSNLFYDDQRQLYVAYHRSDFGVTLSGDTERNFVMTECRDLLKPWPFEPVSQAQATGLAKNRRVHDLIPWYLDNGPLTPGGFAFEYPWVFTPDEKLDPRETDIYVPKAIKYPWAADTYLAFPVIYFHYEETKPLTRMILMTPDRERGSGPVETQVAVSRNGIQWKRYPRPAYVGNGIHNDWPVNQAYIAHGMVKRGNEIWQYYFGTEIYHSTWQKDDSKNAVYRVVQRLDGFVSADAPYGLEGYLITKPLRFSGNRLLLNIDTDATGYAQVGFLDEKGLPVKGYTVDDCVYINGDFSETEVEWFQNWKEFTDADARQMEEAGKIDKKFKFSRDLTVLAGRTLQIVFRLRGCKLYAMQFKSF
jgi:hypothetical protein